MAFNINTAYEPRNTPTIDSVRNEYVKYILQLRQQEEVLRSYLIKEKNIWKKKYEDQKCEMNIIIHKHSVIAETVVKLQKQNQELTNQLRDEKRENNEIMLENRNFAETVVKSQKQNQELTKQFREMNENMLTLQKEHQKHTKKLRDNNSTYEKRNSCVAVTEINKRKTRNKDGFIYLVVSKSYAKKHLFKLGSTGDLKKRLPPYNTIKISKDRCYYGYYRKVSNMRYVENVIKNRLQNFRESNNNEFLNIPFHVL